MRKRQLQGHNYVSSNYQSILVILLRRLENFAKEKAIFPTFSLAFLLVLAVQRLPSLLSLVSIT